MNKPSFAGKRVLLLQGPVGPFFYNLAKDLRAQGATVFKFNFNAGDWLFYPRNAQAFRGDLSQWPAVLEAFVHKHQIEAVLLFGDCRPVHAPARALAAQLGLALGVFEEGYLRPNHVTLEGGGVNAYSRLAGLAASNAMPTVAAEPCAAAACAAEPAQPVGNAFWHSAAWGMLYFLAAWLGQHCWNHALHHRRMSVLDSPWWWLSFGRKFWFKQRQRGIQEWLCQAKQQQFFLVPLQVYNDAQILVHSDYASVVHFIAAVMKSYAQALARDSALAECVLVFKHHPMDRGHRYYGRAIERLARRLGLQGKVLYIHDQHLPSLLKAARGVVVVNSTVGFSALQHGAAVKVCGRALYDAAGLTFAGTLAQFWSQAHAMRPCRAQVRAVKNTLLLHTQLNGSFYRKLRGHVSHTGCGDLAVMAQRLWPSAQANSLRVQAMCQRRCTPTDKAPSVHALNCCEHEHGSV